MQLRKSEIFEMLNFMIKSFRKFVLLKEKLNPKKGDTQNTQLNGSRILFVHNNKEIDKMKYKSNLPSQSNEVSACRRSRQEMVKIVCGVA